MNGKKARAQRKMFGAKSKPFIRKLRKQDKIARLTGIGFTSTISAVPETQVHFGVGARNPPRHHPVRSAFAEALVSLSGENPPISAFERAQKIHSLRFGNAAGRMSRPQLERYIATA